MLAFGVTIKKPELKALVLALMHGGLMLFSLVSVFFRLDSTCRTLFWSYLFVYSLCGLVQTLLEWKLPRMNLFEPVFCKRIKWLILALLLPVAAELVLAVMWWAQWPYNPLYCMFCTELGLPLAFGLAVTIHAFVAFVLYVQVGHAYTKRKYFLICIGGPQNEIIREELPAAAGLQLRLNLVVEHPHPEQYQHFEDGHDQVQLAIHQQPFEPEKHEGKECPICLQELTKEKLVGSLPCHHYFHYDCLSNWVAFQPTAATCPVCRGLVQ